MLQEDATTPNQSYLLTGCSLTVTTDRSQLCIPGQEEMSKSIVAVIDLYEIDLPVEARISTIHPDHSVIELNLNDSIQKITEIANDALFERAEAGVAIDAGRQSEIEQHLLREAGIRSFMSMTNCGGQTYVFIPTVVDATIEVAANRGAEIAKLMDDFISYGRQGTPKTLNAESRLPLPLGYRFTATHPDRVAHGLSCLADRSGDGSCAYTLAGLVSGGGGDLPVPGSDRCVCRG
jgi:hypothetical protein